MLDKVLAQLTLRRRFTRRAVRFERGGGALILQIEGDPPQITPWLRALFRSHRAVVPVNNPSGVQAEQSEDLQVLEQLQAIVEGCGYGGRVARGLPIVFPRFAAARTALYDWHSTERLPPRRARDLKKHIKDAIMAERQHTLQDVSPRVAPLVEDELVTGQFGGAVGLALKAANMLRFPYYRTVRWYRTRRFPDARTFDVVCERLDEMNQGRQLLLVEALLADIDAHYRLFRRLNRARRPVILLPDVDKVPARRIIRDRLLEAFDDRAQDLYVYPVVITTSEPDRATPAKGARDAVQAEDLAQAIADRYQERETVAELRAQGKTDEPLPSRLLRVSLGEVPEPRANSGKRILGPVTLLTSVAVLATAGFVVSRMPESCGDALEIKDGECVGVSDGSDVFMPEVRGMKEVSARIAEQNRAVEGEKHATVALMIPMESDNPAVQRQILSEIQGAFLAQAEVNQPTSAKPAIRLVLANPGRGYGDWQYTVDKLVEREPDLRIVAGFNLSLTATKKALTYVTNTLKIPAVASVVTADDFANPENKDPAPFPGLARVVSTTAEQARALLAFDSRLASAETALVADERPDDNYNRSLRDAFAAARRKQGGGAVQDMLFESPGVEVAGYTPNEFEDFAGNICRSNASVVYFAGRALHLKLFIEKLAGTYCREKKSYTVITGSDATTLDERLTPADRALLKGDPGSGKPAVTIRYIAPAHPGEWSASPGKSPAPPYVTESRDAMNSLQRGIEANGPIGPVSLNDGRTIVTHDVILTASRALARAVHTSGQEVPSTDRIRRDLRKLNSDLRVRGASGWICLSNAGNPYNKALVVVRLEPGASQLKLEGLAWPAGQPPKRDDQCVVH